MIYLDSAATSFQKPPSVAAAMQDALRQLSSPGRGGYPAANRAAETSYLCRTELAELFHVPMPEQVVFTFNATHGLNIAIKTLVQPGSHVVISGYEHNAVTRPLAAIPNVRVTVASAPLFRPDEVLEAFSRAIGPDTDAVICNHVSNVFGFVQPVEALAKLCSARKIPLLIDASQSAGVLPLDFEALGAAFVAMPGHKGLYGPQGTGVLLCNPNFLPKTLMEGGTGSVSMEQDMPEFLPDRLEAGTHNMPGIAGLLEGVRFVRQTGLEQICAHERNLTLTAAEELKKIPGTEVFSRPDLAAQTGVVSFRCNQMDVEELGDRLAQRDIAVRCGLHCAPEAHQTAGTEQSGTVRVSLSTFNKIPEIAAFLTAVREELQ